MLPRSDVVAVTRSLPARRPRSAPRVVSAAATVGAVRSAAGVVTRVTGAVVPVVGVVVTGVAGVAGVVGVVVLDPVPVVVRAGQRAGRRRRGGLVRARGGERRAADRHVGRVRDRSGRARDRRADGRRHVEAAAVAAVDAAPSGPSRSAVRSGASAAPRRCRSGARRGRGRRRRRPRARPSRCRHPAVGVAAERCCRCPRRAPRCRRSSGRRSRTSRGGRCCRSPRRRGCSAGCTRRVGRRRVVVAPVVAGGHDEEDVRGVLDCVVLGCEGLEPPKDAFTIRAPWVAA